VTRYAYQHPFIGPLVPPPSVAKLTAASRPRVPAEVLAIPTDTRTLVGRSLDLVFRGDSGLRLPSFYIGFIVLATVAPFVAILGLQAASGYPLFDPEAPPTPVDGWIALAALPAVIGYMVASVEARTLATAVVGGRMEGRPLRLPESVSIARKRFWRMFLAQAVVTILTLIVATIVTLVVDFGLLDVGPVELIDVGISLLVGLVVALPFVYVPAGLVLGEVGLGEAISRSFRLVRLRGALAIVLALFASAPQILIGIGIGTGLDLLVRVAGGPDGLASFPLALVIPVTAVLSFALGTLVFVAESFAASPAVHAFASLTHYTHGLEVGRAAPVDVRRLWAPWFTPGLALVALIAILALVGGVLALD
jgi:hypothetical protein